jgi:aspartate dehydrogenase
MPQRRVGIIGCGTIGSQLALAVDSGKVPNASVISLFDIVDAHANALGSKLASKPRVYSEFGQFVSSQINIVVEAASQDAVRNLAKPVLSTGKDLMLMSVGALADKAFLSDVLEASASSGARIYIPTGAIAGIDAIRSVKHLLESVTLTTTKNPKALAGAPFFESSKIEIDNIKNRMLIYEGPASEAVMAFPANVNVAAVLSLAGLGPEETKVRIVADPDISTNQHEINATGSFGEIRIVVNNAPSPGNPKTSFLAILSAIECLRSISDIGMRIGS